ncbi:MAG: hypothetical protein LBV60_23805 [Streptomyces sp.]|nr:hypothetical protein [Streptomyces sp.]
MTPARPAPDDPAAILTWTQQLLTLSQKASAAAQTDAVHSDDEHDEAKRNHEKVTDLAERQTRHSNAHTRRTALDEHAAGHTRLREQFDRGRKALTVWPLLDALDRTAAALEEARAGEHQARALLAPEHQREDLHALGGHLERQHAERGRIEGLIPDGQLHAQLGLQLEDLAAKEQGAHADLDEAENGSPHGPQKRPGTPAQSTP